MDYPYHLKGILYFPKINSEYESIEGTIKLYNNQVFIADNIKEVIPEYLLLLKGVIDCPDLPLNVSRSQLQNDGFVKKISDYITKKVAEKLSGLCKTDRENYEKYWDDISPFIKYGILRDEKFAEKMKDYILFKDLEDQYLTLPELKEKKNDNEESLENKFDASSTENASDKSSSAGDDAADTATESSEETSAKEEAKEQRVYYVSDALAQSQYIRIFKEHKKEAVYLTERIDSAFISELEAKNEGLRFQRIDANFQEAMQEKLSEEEQKNLLSLSEKLEKSFQKNLSKDKLQLKLERLLSDTPAALLSISEESRRMQDMMKMYAISGMPMGELPLEESLVLNEKHPLVSHLLKNEALLDTEEGKLLEEQIYDLARIQNAGLDGEDMKRFVERSEKLLLAFVEKK